MDRAGNATHYTKDADVGNNAPLIREFHLGTFFGNVANPNPESINWFGANLARGNSPGTGWLVVAGDETKWGNMTDRERDSLDRTAVSTNFVIRNRVFDIRLNALFGNGRKHYSVTYVEEKRHDPVEDDVLGELDLVNVKDLVPGRLYSIHTRGFTTAGNVNTAIGLAPIRYTKLSCYVA
jgi:hypothetical protein